MTGLDLLARLVPKAKHSVFWLWILNRALFWAVPFNRPHRFKLFEIDERTVRTTAASRRANHNHIKGIHACAIATTAEFSSGFLLLMHLDPKHYRLIMSRIEVEYHYQAKQRIISTSTLTAQQLADEILEPLQTRDSVSIRLESMVQDVSGNEIASAVTTWQVKKWNRVRTQL